MRQMAAYRKDNPGKTGPVRQPDIGLLPRPASKRVIIYEEKNNIIYFFKIAII